MKIILTISFTLFLSNVCFASSEAEIYLQKMLEKYKLLSSYEDHGHSTTKFINTDNRKHIKELKFRTKFIENELIYFEWIEMPTEIERQLLSTGFKDEYIGKPKKNVIWKDETGVYTKYYFKGKKSRNNISAALSSATGRSDGLAWMVPRYLSPEAPCLPNFGAEKLRILSSKNNNIVIELSHSSGRIEILHIDKITYLLKKYEEKRRLPDGTSTYQVAEYNVTASK